MAVDTKTFGPITFLKAEERFNAELRRTRFHIEFEDEAGEWHEYVLPMYIIADPENGPEFDSDLLVDDRNLTAAEQEVWDAFHDHCCAESERRAEGEY